MEHIHVLRILYGAYSHISDTEVPVGTIEHFTCTKVPVGTTGLIVILPRYGNTRRYYRLVLILPIREYP